MAAFWTEADYDDHELVQLVRRPELGLTAIIALHSTHLGPGAGGTRFWHYADPAGAMHDALRLSRGMSYKNAMAGLPMGGGKGVILADQSRSKTPAMLAAFGAAIETLGGRYVTAEDVGMSEADMVAIAQETDHVSGLPVADGLAGGDPGPFTAYGIYLGIKAAVAHKLGKSSLDGRSCRNAGHRQRRRRSCAVAGPRWRQADFGRYRRGAGGGTGTGAGRSIRARRVRSCKQAATYSAPMRWALFSTTQTIAALDCAIVAGRREQPARPCG